MYPSIPIAERIALQDTVIPLTDHITTSTGERMSQIHVRKGQVVSIDVMAYHQLSASRPTPIHCAHTVYVDRSRAGVKTRGSSTHPAGSMV
jgi:hypothetical protein